KIGAAMRAESYWRSFGLPVSIIRPFNTFGPRQSARAIIPTIISQALSADEVRIGSLAPTRDLNYVEDIVEAFVRAGSQSEAVGRVINVGSGREISIGDLATLILRLTKSKARVVVDQQRIRPENSEVERLLCNADQARKLL